MKSKIILAFILCSLAFSIAVPALGQADELGRNTSDGSKLDPGVGDRFVIRGRGLAIHVEDGTRTRFKVSFLLECSVTDVSGPKIKFKVERGSMTIGGKALEFQGEGSCNTKERQIAVHLDTSDGKVVLHGHARIIRGRLVIALHGRGNVGDDNYDFKFLCLAKLQQNIHPETGGS